MKNRLHELDLGTGGGGDWNDGNSGGNNGGDSWNSGDGNDGGNKPKNPKTPDNGGNKKRKGGSNNTVCINKVQNLLKELNPSFNVSGSMDANTLIEIMNQLNELEKSLTVTKDEVAVIEKPKYLPSIDITEL
jgi:hypothetical protein